MLNAHGSPGFDHVGGWDEYEDQSKRSDWGVAKEIDMNVGSRVDFV